MKYPRPTVGEAVAIIVLSPILIVVFPAVWVVARIFDYIDRIGDTS